MSTDKEETKKSSPQGILEAHVLIVDDDAAIRESMNEFVDMSGYQSTTAASATSKDMITIHGHTPFE